MRHETAKTFAENTNWTRSNCPKIDRNSQGGGPKRAEVGQDTGSVDTEREEYAFWASALSSTV